MGDIRFALMDLSSGTPEFKEFHNLLFKNTAVSTMWVDWMFLQLAPFTRVHCAWDDSKLVGMWCVEPKKLMIDDGTLISVGRCFAVGIHPDYRRQNLFVELSKHAIAEEKRIGQYEYVLGFPQVDRPVIAAHMKSGWEHVQRIEINSYRPDERTPIIPMHHSARLTDFLHHERTEYVGGFFEWAGYGDVRWLSNPDNSYITLRWNQAYIVLKPYATACHILDFAGPSEDVRHVLNMAKTLARRHHWEEITVWNAFNEKHHSDIKDCGFVGGAQFAASIDLLAVRINAKHPLLLSQTHFQMGGEEMY